MIQVQVLLFSVLRERIGAASCTVALAAPATGVSLLETLAQQYPALAPYRSIIRLAVNEVYTATSVALQDGDEVALITPVSGG